MKPKKYKYSKENEWIFLEPDDEVIIGITDYARSRLGEIIYSIELAAPGTQVERFGKIGEIESEKAVSDLFTPVSGQVLEINQDAINNPNLVNQDPYGDGWLIKLRLSKPSELDGLMNRDEYDKFIAGSDEESSE